MRRLVGQQPSQLQHSSILHWQDLYDFLQRLITVRMSFYLKLTELMVLYLAELLKHRLGQHLHIILAVDHQLHDVR